MLHYWERIRGWRRLLAVTDDFGTISWEHEPPYGLELD